MIDPRKPDFGNTPVSAARPMFSYAPRARVDQTAGAQSGRAGEMEIVIRQAGRNGHGVATATETSRQVSDETQAPTALVTITTAFYNTGEIFRETARCVFGQSLQAWEWVIVNDGSTDAAALAILDEFREIDPRVRVVDHAKNSGLSAARNTGFREARTPYVYQLDSDDLIEPTSLEKCLWHMHTHPEAAFVSSYVVGFQAQEYLWEKGFHNGAEFLRENLATPMGIIRRAVFDEVGGYDETNRGGMEDWEFWLRCASRGHWGQTIPEYLAWYRRRDQHWDTWANMRAEERRAEFHARMMDDYGPTLRERFPHVPARPQRAFEAIRVEPGLANPLAKGAPRLLLVVPWLTLGGADKFNVAMVRELMSRGWEVSVVTTLAGDNSWLPEFSRLTPDVFVTPHFLHPADIPAFVRYMIESREPDAVMISNSELGYHILPYLRTTCPGPVYVDLSHMEEPWWKDGGHPRYGAGSQSLLDLNIVVSEHLKRWQVEQGADPERIEVCYVSACEDARFWHRDYEARAKTRDEMSINADQPVILYAGRIVEQKRPRLFAQAMRELAANGNDFTCLVAGDGPDMGWLRWFVSEHGLAQQVRLLGAVPHARMHDLMSASDIFFLPSQWEGIAISIYEAMSMELAVVGAEVGGQLELVTEDCGILVRRRDGDGELEEYVAALTALVADPDRCDAMGRAGRARIQSGFEPAHMGERILELLDKARQWKADSPRGAVDMPFAVECARRGLEYLRAWDLAESNFHHGRHLAHERDAIAHERDALMRERDALIQQQHEMRLDVVAAARSNGMHHLPDPAVMAQRIIAENMRYVAVDRLNTMLKSLKVHTALKSLTVRVLRPRR